MAKPLSERIPTPTVFDKVKSETWEPNEVMQDLRLPSAVRALLEGALESFGLTITDVEVSHPYSHVKHMVTRVDGLSKPLYLLGVDFRVVDKPTQANVDAVARIPQLLNGSAFIRIFTGHPVPPHLSFVKMLGSWRRSDLDAYFVSDRQLVDYGDAHCDADDLRTLLAMNELNEPVRIDIGGTPKPSGGLDPASRGPRIFVSYAHTDEDVFGRVRVHLNALVQEENDLDVWTDVEIKASDEWRDKIKDALDNATAGLLLLSADFLASPFVKAHELNLLLAAAADGGLRIFWIVVEPVDVPDKIQRYQALHKAPPLGTLEKAGLEEALAVAMKKLRDELTL